VGVSKWIGRAPAVRLAWTQIREAACTDLSVLIVGEPGTGRHLAARTLHELSSHAGGAFVRVHCGALHPGQAAEVLFSHPRRPAEERRHPGPDEQDRLRPAPSARVQAPQGLETFAAPSVPRSAGALLQAEGGTLFLDEVEALPLPVQRQLLLHMPSPSREAVTPGTGVRIVAATGIDMGRAARGGTVCAELYYRLAIVTVRLDPLRERLQDLPDLIASFIRELGIRPHSETSPISPEGLAMLAEYQWPGNIWELKSLFRRAAVLHGSRPVTAREIRQLLLEAPWIREPVGGPVTRRGAPPSPLASRN